MPPGPVPADPGRDDIPPPGDPVPCEPSDWEPVITRTRGRATSVIVVYERCTS